jgi:SpoVK/Ycf46/Vps4 family AAA+-type ATPase
MNNSMQNILLQEMENFKGILMATTNLINNLDSAFERRFLFKIKFSKPSILSRTKIWQNKIETISEQDAAQLAADFEFSGGQIDNITKKMLMRSLISDKPCSIDDIIEYCQNELFVKKGNTKVIGFTTTNNLKNHS